MTDLISREDVIRLLVDKYKFTTSEATEILSALPSAEAVQGWITDRNPTEDGTYLVTIVDEDGGFVCELHYGEPLNPICKVNGPCWYDADAEFGDCPYCDIIAWQPLPKPCKGGDDECHK